MNSFEGIPRYTPKITNDTQTRAFLKYSLLKISGIPSLRMIKKITGSIVIDSTKVFLDFIPKYKFTNLYVTIPERFKSSLLNLIYKNLADSKDRIDPSGFFINCFRL